MADTYSQLYVQIIFAVQGRANLLRLPFRKMLFEYIAGIIRNKNQKSIIVNGYADHVHAFIGLQPTMPVSDIARDIKNSSAKYINANGWIKGKFSWQAGYGAFTYSHSQIEQVYHYILNQEKHHSKTSFREEYLGFLEKFKVEYKEQYLFKWVDALE